MMVGALFTEIITGHVSFLSLHSHVFTPYKKYGLTIRSYDGTSVSPLFLLYWGLNDK